MGESLIVKRWHTVSSKSRFLISCSVWIIISEKLQCTICRIRIRGSRLTEWVPNSQVSIYGNHSSSQLSMLRCSVNVPNNPYLIVLFLYILWRYTYITNLASWPPRNLFEKSFKSYFGVPRVPRPNLMARVRLPVVWTGTYGDVHSENSGNINWTILTRLIPRSRTRFCYGSNGTTNYFRGPHIGISD